MLKQSASRRVCVLVLGMHRSGTSALTRVLSLLGCDLPKSIMPPTSANEAGYWESNAVYQLDDRLLASAGTSWSDWLEFNSRWFESPKAGQFRQEAVKTIAEEFGTSPLIVLKDPRICRLVPFWTDVFAELDTDPVAVLPIRNPLEVAASLHRRDGMEPLLGQLLWLRHVLDAECSSRGMRRVFTTYDDLLENWAKIADRTQSTLEVAWPRFSLRVASEIDEFLGASLRHHKESSEKILNNSTISPWLRQAFEIFWEWGQNGERAQDIEKLDRIRGEFNAACPTFARLVDAGGKAQVKARSLESSFEQVNALLATANRKIDEQQQKAAQSEQGLTAVQKRVAEDEQKLVQLQAELDKRTAEVRARDATIADLQSKAGQLDAASATQRETINALEQELKKRSSEHLAVTQTHDETRVKLAEFELLSSQRQETVGELEKRLGTALEELNRAHQEIASLGREVRERTGEAQLAVQTAELAQLRLTELEGSAALQQEANLRLEQEIAMANRRLSDAEKVVETLQAEVQRRTAAHETALEAHSLAQLRLTEYDSSSSQQRDTIDWLEKNLASVRQQHDEGQRRVTSLESDLASISAELQSSRRARGDLEISLAEARNRLSESEIALRRSQQDRDQHFEAKSASGKIVEGLKEHITLLLADLDQKRAQCAQLETSSRLLSQERDQALANAREMTEARSKLEAAHTAAATGLEAHTLRLQAVQADYDKLRSELSQRTTEIEMLSGAKREAEKARIDLEQARIAHEAQLRALQSNCDRTKSELEKARTVHEAELRASQERLEKVKSDLGRHVSEIALLNGANTEAMKMSAQLEKVRAGHDAQLQALKADVEKARSEKARLEVKLKERFEEIATLTRLLAEKKSAASRREGPTEELRGTAAKEMGRAIAALLSAQDWGFMPNRIRVRQQMSLLERSGIFDAEWYVRQYQDIAAAGVDPLRHYVEFGAREGREPNATLSQYRKSSEAE